MTGFRLGRIFGIDVHLHASWLIIAGLVMWSLVTGALPADFPDVMGGARIAMAAAITLLFFLSLLVHELAHSVVAMARGIPVDRITFFLFGGMAQTSRDSRGPGEEFMIAIAGPLSSLLLAGLAFTLWYLGNGSGWSTAVVGAAAYIGVLNLVLALFNMLPGFPMDGGRVLRAIIWKATGSVTRATLWASRVGAGMAWLLMAYGAWLVLRGDGMGGAWLVLIGWFIRHAARSSYQQHLMVRMREMARETLVSQYPWPGHDPRSGGGGRPPADASPGDGAIDGGRDVTHLSDRDL
jgi:Zn-dependent protease